MPDHDLEQLLGGFAADTLTPEEKERLYSAALGDQQLFDALADEQSLKELLANPAVRRRLLQALNQTATQTGTGDTAAWLDWFRRPSGLAWAGGLAAAVIAVVLGTKIYQDSLKQASQSMMTEETRPAAPARQAPIPSQPHPSSTPGLPATTLRQEAPAENVANGTLPLGRMTQQEPATAPASGEQKVSDSVAGLEKRSREQKTTASKREMFLRDSDTTSRRAGPSAVQKSSPDAPADSNQAPAYLRAPSTGLEQAPMTPTIGARARFFGEALSQTTLGATAAEQKRPVRSATESAPKARMQERIDTPSSQLDRTVAADTSSKPLGLRYGFMIKGTNGQDYEVSPSTASVHNRPVRLSVESNQDAYIQIWIIDDSDTPTLILPPKDSGNTMLKLFAGQRPSVLLPTTDRPITITARLSRIPLRSTLEADSSSTTLPSLHILQETVTAIAGTPQQEEATYTVNQDASVNQLTVTLPFPAP